MEEQLSEWLVRARSDLASRSGRRVSQDEIARAAGISRSYYGFLEAGYNPTTGKPVQPDRDLVRRLALALDAPAEDALRAAGFGEHLSVEEREVISHLRRLTPEQAKVVERLVTNPERIEGLRLLGVNDGLPAGLTPVAA